jgi:peptide/nickel transport system permease protein
MLEFIVRRLLSALPAILLVVVIIFSVVRLTPGDPAAALLGPGATDQQIEKLREQLDLDEPVTQQFLSYIGGLLRGDLGRSLRTGQPIRDELMQRLPATIELSVTAMLIALVLGIPIGILSGTLPNTVIDHVVRLLSLIGVSAPAFWIALLFQVVFAIYLDILPVSGRLGVMLEMEPITGALVLDGLLRGRLDVVWNTFRHLMLPASVLAAFYGAMIARFLRASVREQINEDYVRTAYAKGLGRETVFLVHVLRNSLLPVLTVIGLKFAELLGGAILTETVFSWPGMGRYIYKAIQNRDYPVIQGGALFFTMIYVLSSLIVDILYGVLDPRIREGEKY